MPGLSVVEVSLPDYKCTSLVGGFDKNVEIVIECVEEHRAFRGGEIGVDRGSGEVKTVDVALAVWK